MKKKKKINIIFITIVLFFVLGFAGYQIVNNKEPCVPENTDNKPEIINMDYDFKVNLSQCYEKEKLSGGEFVGLVCFKLNESLIKEVNEKLIIEQASTKTYPNKQHDSKYQATCSFEYIKLEEGYKKIKLNDCILEGEYTSDNTKKALLRDFNGRDYWKVNDSYFERCECMIFRASP